LAETPPNHTQIENDLFRVHSHFFVRESDFFREALQAVGPGEAPKGSSESNAFVLEDISCDDFDRFLWVFYNQ